MKQYDYLIVGAGLYGAVFAHEAKKAGARIAPTISNNIIALRGQTAYKNAPRGCALGARVDGC